MLTGSNYFGIGLFVWFKVNFFQHYALEQCYTNVQHELLIKLHYSGVECFNFQLEVFVECFCIHFFLLGALRLLLDVSCALDCFPLFQCGCPTRIWERYKRRFEMILVDKKEMVKNVGSLCLAPKSWRESRKQLR